MRVLRVFDCIALRSVPSLCIANHSGALPCLPFAWPRLPFPCPCLPLPSLALAWLCLALPLPGLALPALAVFARCWIYLFIYLSMRYLPMARRLACHGLACHGLVCLALAAACFELEVGHRLVRWCCGWCGRFLGSGGCTALPIALSGDSALRCGGAVQASCNRSYLRSAAAAGLGTTGCRLGGGGLVWWVGGCGLSWLWAEVRRNTR